MGHSRGSKEEPKTQRKHAVKILTGGHRLASQFVTPTLHENTRSIIREDSTQLVH